jgi:regulator of RNase E activity RraA
MNLEICDRFARLYNGAVADILDEMGFHKQALPSSLRPLAPEMTVHGFAMPVLGRATASENPERIFVPLLKMLGDVQPGHVVVTLANDSVAAHLGELSTTTLQVRGCRGAVIHGGVRDVDYIARLGFPVFCCYHTPLDIVGRWELAAYNVEIEIEGVKIKPGDFISADKDGVLVVPAHVVDEVLIKAEEIVAIENKVRSAIVEGSHPLDAYYRYGRF